MPIIDSDWAGSAFARVVWAHSRSQHHFGKTAVKLFDVAVAAAFALAAGSAQAATFSTEPLVSSPAFERLLQPVSDETDGLVTLTTDADRKISNSAGPTSRLPEPSTWAMLIMGFGAAGAAMRRRHSDKTYRLEECAPHGGVMIDEFAAPDDAAALDRAVSVVAGDFKLWRGDVLVRG